MPPGRESAHRESTAELLAKSNLGKIGRFFDDADAVQLLSEAVRRDGSISANRTIVNKTFEWTTGSKRAACESSRTSKSVYTAE
jgi:hypothetical protein